MAAFMADYELFQIEITRTYGKNEWRDDIRKLFRKSGVEGNIQINHNFESAEYRADYSKHVSRYSVYSNSISHFY
jgi:hypothetical protein